MGFPIAVKLSLNEVLSCTMLEMSYDESHEKSSAFLRLYKGMDCSFWMNTAISPKDFPPTLWGFDNQNKMIALASSPQFRLSDSLICVGDKEFVKTSSYMLEF